jgi:lipoprotein signal peptidase
MVGTDISKPFTIEVAKIVQPNGGETLSSGSSYPIQWEINGTKSPVTKVNLYYTMDGGVSYGLINNLAGSDRSYNWTVPTPLSNKKNTCYVKVVAYNGSTIVGSVRSDKPFTIEVAKIVQPNGGEALKSGSSYPIQWEINGTRSPVTKVNLYYTKNKGVSYGLITSIQTVDPGTRPWAMSHPWTPMVMIKKPYCKVKVVLYNTENIILSSDVSDRYLTISP